MAFTLQDTSCASLPATALAELAQFRTRGGVRVLLQDQTAWLTWPKGSEEIPLAVYPIANARLFVREGSNWHLFQRHLPTLQMPDLSVAQPLQSTLFPERVSFTESESANLQSLPLRLVSDAAPRETSALRCSLSELLTWLDMVPKQRFESLIAVMKEQSVLIRGEALPPLAGEARYWGERILIPLGFRCEPDLPEMVVGQILELSSDQIILFEKDRLSTIDLKHFQPLRRSAARLLLLGGR